MTGKQLKEWAATIPDDSVIEIERYGWEAVDHKKIRAMFTSHPQLSLADTNNLEDVEAKGLAPCPPWTPGEVKDEL